MVIWHLKQTRKVKKLGKWVPYKLTKNFFKNHHFEVSCLILKHNNNEPFLNQIMMCDKKWILYDNWWHSWTVNKLQSTSQSHTCTKQVMVTVCWSAACLIHYSFLNPRETITSEKYAQQITEMHQKLQWLQLALVNRKGPILHQDKCPTAHHATSVSKVEQIGQQSFASSAIFTWPLTNGLPLLQASWQLFARKTLP